MNRLLIACAIVVAAGVPASLALAQSSSTEPRGEETPLTLADCPAADRAFQEAGWAPDNTALPACPSDRQVDGLIEFCPPDDCRAVAVDADTSGQRSYDSFGEQLEADGIPASECPEALAIFEAHGERVDVFIGRCPTTDEAQNLAAPSRAFEKLRQLKQAAKSRSIR